jgi:sialate O-acetylesterase
MRIMRIAVAFCLLTAAAANVQAELRLPSLFTDHMVLQRDMPLRVWGWAAPGTEVDVVIAGQTKRGTADNDGRWQVELDALAAGGPHTLLVEGDGRVQINDVLVGEVWVCSGQSNMEWPVAASDGADLELLSADQGQIRLLTVGMPGEQQPLDDFDGAWELCNSGTASQFSAVGYHFGRRLHETLGVPIGLIDNAWGGSAAEAWTPRAKLEQDELFAGHLSYWDGEAAKADEAAIRTAHAKQHANWIARMQKAVAAGEPIPAAPRPQHPLMGNQRAANLFNGRVEPIAGYGIRGVIWYQGESNAGRAAAYRTLFPTMISAWRERWGQGDFPFYWVQLADFQDEVAEPVDSPWAELREAQTMTLDKLEHVGEAVIIDIGEGKDIHPKNKRTVADRLARLALANDYGLPVVATSPRMKEVTISENTATVSFAGVDRLATFDVPQVRGFAIAGADGKWVNADAKIVDGNKVEVSSKLVDKPVAVRYAWAQNPVCNLYSGAGLPVTPFRWEQE